MSIRLGDRGPLVRKWREVMARRFAGYAKVRGELPLDTDEYGPRAASWQQEYQIRTKQVPTGVVSDWDLAALKIAGPPPQTPNRPWVITVAGHMGAWDNGPAYWSALPLHIEGRATVQGVGYDTRSIPFNNRHGFQRLDEALHTLKPPNTDYAIMAHSQGAIIACDYIEKVILQRPDDPALKGFKGGVMFGNPRRPAGVVAPWIGDPPPAMNTGIAPNCLPGKLPGVEEVSRRGDLYADKAPGASAEYKVAIYKIIAMGQFFGADSITEQLAELGINPLSELWPVVQALIGAIGFGINMDAHNVFDLTPPREHVARILGI